MSAAASRSRRVALSGYHGFLTVETPPHGHGSRPCGDARHRPPCRADKPAMAERDERIDR